MILHKCSVHGCLNPCPVAALVCAAHQKAPKMPMKLDTPEGRYAALQAGHVLRNDDEALGSLLWRLHRCRLEIKFPPSRQALDEWQAHCNLPCRLESENKGWSIYTEPPPQKLSTFGVLQLLAQQKTVYAARNVGLQMIGSTICTLNNAAYVDLNGFYATEDEAIRATEK